jgi:hypothetical protein
LILAQFQVGDRVLYGKLRCVVVGFYRLKGEWLYNLSDRVGGEIYFEGVPEVDLRGLKISD